MNADILLALDELERERGISKKMIMETISAALEAAYKKHTGLNQNIRIDFDAVTGEWQVYVLYMIVEEVDNPAIEISLADARRKNPNFELGDTYAEPATPHEFGRIAAQTAKQVIVQRIRETERDMMFDEYMDRSNELANAEVQRIEQNNVYVQIDKAEGLLPMAEQIPGEKYYPNELIKVYITQVRRTNKGPQLVVSRSHPDLVKRLFEFEVPEIAGGVVQILAIAREAGQRTKMAVWSKNADVDPIGTCVGQRGNRIDAIMGELNGEKIDIIKWDSDPATFIANALAPSKVLLVNIEERDHIANAIVPDNQLSLAIGRRGQNARLAARLTGWKIDIKSQSQAIELEAASGDDDDYEDDY